jgi:hypothetical protein
MSVPRLLAMGLLIVAAVIGLITLLLRTLGWSYWGAE